jgi:hypothetical protein
VSGRQSGYQFVPHKRRRVGYELDDKGAGSELDAMFEDERLSMYDDSGMITYSSLSLVWVNNSRNDSILALTRTGVKRDLL